MGVTLLKRFEATGGTTLKNLVAIFRGLDLLDHLEDLVPDPSTHGPLEILEAERAKLRRQQRQRAPRRAPAHVQQETNPAGKNDWTLCARIPHQFKSQNLLSKNENW